MHTTHTNSPVITRILIKKQNNLSIATMASQWFASWWHKHHKIHISTLEADKLHTEDMFSWHTTNLCLMQHKSHVLSKTAILQDRKYDMLKTTFLRKHPVDSPSMISLQQPFCPKNCFPGFQLTSSSSIAITTSIVAVAGAGQKGLAPFFFSFLFLGL